MTIQFVNFVEPAVNRSLKEVLLAGSSIAFTFLHTFEVTRGQYLLTFLSKFYSSPKKLHDFLV